MIEMQVNIEERIADLVIRNHNGAKSMIVSIAGFQASLCELEVLSLARQGFTQPEIASRMEISQNTVKNRLWSVKRRNKNCTNFDYHGQSIYSKAGALTWPIYIEGLKTIRDGSS